MLGGCLFSFTACTTPESGWLEKGTERLKDYQTSGTGKSQLTNLEIGSGLKDALRVGTVNVVNRLGQADGFATDPNVHIPLPKGLKRAQSALGKVGMSSPLDDLEVRLNRAAEAAIPKVKDLFWQAISKMTMDDVTAIYDGPDDAATRYFQGKMTTPLREEMRPVVASSLQEVGAVRAYNDVMEQYRSLPFAPDVQANLTDYVIDKGMDGVFFYLAREEAAIRHDPAKRTTELLKRVFR